MKITVNGEIEEYLKGLKRSERNYLVSTSLDNGIEKKKEYEEKQKNIESFIKENHYSSLWYAVRTNLKNCIKTYSDAGSILIGNCDFAAQFPNGYGDGISRVGFIDRDNKILEFMNYRGTFTTSNGNCGVYEYDCRRPIDNNWSLQIAEGAYSVFSYDGLVALVKE